jgi:hypothetical protein
MGAWWSMTCETLVSKSLYIVFIGWVAGDYKIQNMDFCRITTCHERRINRVHLNKSYFLFKLKGFFLYFTPIVHSVSKLRIHLRLVLIIYWFIISLHTCCCSARILRCLILTSAFTRITTCHERRINRVHLNKSSLYTNCQIVRAERNSILQALLICIYIAFM